MAKELTFGKDARLAMMKGVESVARLVGSTLGPKGRCVVVERIVTDPATKQIVRLSPVTTKDGVSVARAISLPDATENLGCDLVREAALRTVSEAGDGTTASIVLAHALLTEGMKALEAGASPVFIRSGIDKTVSKVVEQIKAMSISSVGREGQIARIAANGDDEIGVVVTDAIAMAGPNGIVTVDQSRTNQTHIDFQAGMRFDSGLRYPDFITDPSRGECVLENPYILLHERRIQSIKQAERLLQEVAGCGRPLLILSEEFELPIVAMLLANLARLKSCLVVAPWFGDRRRDFLKDLGVFTGGTPIFEELGLDLKSAGVEILGQAEKVVVTKGTTTIIGGKSAPGEMKARITSIQKGLKTTENPYEQEVLADRLAKLDGGVAIIKIGAATQSEAKEKQDRTEDAVLSVKCAQEEGVVPGGGITLLRCSENAEIKQFINKLIPQEQCGAHMVMVAMSAPFKQILENGGYSPEVVYGPLSGRGTLGFNALSGEYVDMLETGIVDPAKVVRQAITNAASLAGTMLTAAGTIVHLPEGGINEARKEQSPGKASGAPEDNSRRTGNSRHNAGSAGLWNRVRGWFLG